MPLFRLFRIGKSKTFKKTGIIVKFKSRRLTTPWNKLQILMHNIILHNFMYLFPWLHVLCDLSPINNDR